MMYEEVVADFARRTRANLRAIDALLEQGQQVFEITQLVNSTLGLLVFPQQRYVSAIPQIPIDELERLGWPIPAVRPGFSQPADLRQMIRYFRNAIAHFNIEFIGDAASQLRLIKVWNTRQNGRRTWEAELGVTDLRKLTERFIELLLNETGYERTTTGDLGRAD